MEKSPKSHNTKKNDAANPLMSLPAASVTPAGTNTVLRKSIELVYSWIESHLDDSLSHYKYKYKYK